MMINFYQVSVSSSTANFLLAMKTNVKFRRGLPVGYLNNFGLIHSTKKMSMKKRAKFHAQCHRLLDELLRESVSIQMDNSIDVMAQKFMHDALPPVLNAEEQLTTIQEQGERWNSSVNRVTNIAELQPDTRIRLLRRHCLRVAEDDQAEQGNENNQDPIVAYYTTDNARRYHERPLSTLGVDKETLPALEILFTNYPSFISIDSLPLATIEDRIAFASTLYEKGLIRTEYELEHSDDDEDEDGEDQSDSDDEQGECFMSLMHHLLMSFLIGLVGSKRPKVQQESSSDDEEEEEDDDDDDDDDDD